jgi:DNA-binding transcriptional LysR family regulator
MALNVALLRAFAAVAEHGGFTSAARSLGVSQPAVSRALRELERGCGFTLVERSARGARLTRAGEAFLHDARSVVAAMRAAESTLASLGGLSHGRLHVGASTTIATYVLPAFIGRFVEIHPTVEVRLDTAHTRGVLQMLLDHALDSALTEAPISHPRVRARRWLTDRLVPIAAPGHPLSSRKRIPPSALSSELLLLREPASGTRSIVIAGLRAVGAAPGRTMEIDGPEAIKQIAAHGRGVAIVSRFTVGEQLALGTLVELDIPKLRIERPFYRLSLVHGRSSLAARAFEELLDAAEPVGARSRRRRE